MKNLQNHQSETSCVDSIDVNFEQRLLASQLVSEIRKRPGHMTFMLTDTGTMALAKAFQMNVMEEGMTKEQEPKNLFPESDGTLLTKKEVMLGFKVSHTTLWKWEKKNYLVPVKVGKRVYYKREDILKLIR